MPTQCQHFKGNQMSTLTIAEQQEAAQRRMFQSSLLASRFELDRSELAKTAAIAAYDLALDRHRQLLTLNSIEVPSHE
jgi:hypothetical protein